MSLIAFMLTVGAVTGSLCFSPFLIPWVIGRVRLRRRRTLDAIIAHLVLSPGVEWEQDSAGYIESKALGVRIGSYGYPVWFNNEQVSDPHEHICNAYRKHKRRAERKNRDAQLVKFVDELERRFGA